MNAQDIKKWIFDNDKISELLESLGCQHIRYHSSGYFTCGNPPPADNKQAITVYVPNLNVVNYTRDLPQPSDIFTLIEFYKNINFFYSLKYVCELFGLDIYQDTNKDLPESLKITRMLKKMNSGKTDEDEDVSIKIIDEKVLQYYKTCVNDFWLNDNVSYEIQREWELGYDEYSNRIIIPIRDEIGNLCGVKGRLFKKELNEEEQKVKYLYIEPCPRNKILYGLYKTYPYIKEQGCVIVNEAEKACHQLWSYGYKNCVSTGGEKVSKTQIDKLSRLAVPIWFAFDQDVSEEKIRHIADQFIDGIEIWTIFDKNNLLKEKEAPADRKEIFEELIKNNLYRIK